MSNYATLKSAIQSAVYTNGSGDITGASLQSVLLQMVNTIGDGYVFKDIATPGTSPGTPDENVLYIAPAGTYTNFGSSYKVRGGCLGFFTYNGSWTKSQVQVITTDDAQGEIVAVAPNSHQLSGSNTRWCLDFDPTQNGDLLEINLCRNGYQYFVVGGTASNVWDVNLTADYQDGAFSYLCPASIVRIRVLVRNADEVSAITESEVESNLSYLYTRGTPMDRVMEVRDVIKGDEMTVQIIAPNNSENLNGTNTKRWVFEWLGTINNGDVLEVNCNSGYLFSVFGKTVVGSNVWDIAYNNSQYTTGFYKLACSLGNGSSIRIIASHTDQTQDITQAEAESNILFTLKRTTPYEYVLNSLFELQDRPIDILFVGNSLTQDAVAYVPLVLKNIAPNVRFRLHMYYNGGYKLSQQLTQMSNETACQMFSMCENGTYWWTRNNAVTMKSALSAFHYDIVCLQEYFNNMSSYTSADKQAYGDILKYIKNNYSAPFKVATLVHPPKRDDIQNIYQLTLEGIDWILKNTPTDSAIAAGTATYMAFSTALDNLGDQGHLSPDGTHSQEGLPCMLDAYVTALWILKQLSVPKGVLGDSVRVTAANFNEILVPGPNLGTGVVEGTEDEYWLAQNIATMADGELKRQLSNI